MKVSMKVLMKVLIKVLIKFLMKVLLIFLADFPWLFGVSKSKLALMTKSMVI